MYISKASAVKGSFTIELYNEEADEKVNLSVYPPKMAAIKKLRSMGKCENEDEAIDGMTEILSMILSNNKEKKEIAVEFLDKILDMDDVTNLFSDVFKWVGKIKKK